MSAQMKGFNPKEVKQIASDIIKAGAALYDALGMEPELREHRPDGDRRGMHLQESLRDARPPACGRHGPACTIREPAIE